MSHFHCMYQHWLCGPIWNGEEPRAPVKPHNGLNRPAILGERPVRVCRELPPASQRKFSPRVAGADASQHRSRRKPRAIIKML